MNNVLTRLPNIYLYTIFREIRVDDKTDVSHGINPALGELSDYSEALTVLTDYEEEDINKILDVLCLNDAEVIDLTT